MSAPASDAMRVRLYSRIPPARADGHGGLKLDWRSDVGRTGVLLDWEPVGRGADAGVPHDVARALATGLCAVATVVGCTASVPEDVDAAWMPVPDGHACRLRAPWWRGARRDLGLLATRDPAAVERLFDDDAFSWSQEAQALFLAPPGTLPRMDRDLVEACFGWSIDVTRERFAEVGVIGLVVAGVDGDVAGLYLLDPALRRPVLGALAEAVASGGGVWEERDGMAHPVLAAAGIDPQADR